MSDELVEMRIGGQSWSAWERVSVSASAKQAARVFAATVDDDYTDQFAFNPGDPFILASNGETIVTGYLEVVDESADAKSHKIEIAGRSKGADTIDSSAVHATGELRNKTILDIARELDQQGVGFSSDIPNLPKLDFFRVNPAETVFQSIERIARDQHLLLQGMPDGSIKITKGSSKRVNTAIVQGVTGIVSAARKEDASQKHSGYKVVGQRSLGSKLKGSIQIQQESKDTSVKRNRPKNLVSETDTDDARAKARADRERNRAFGYSVTATVTVQGWRDDAGALWVPNSIVYVRIPRIKCDMDLLIESVNFIKDSKEGSVAQLQLVHPAAHGSPVGTGKRMSPAFKPGFSSSDAAFFQKNDSANFG